MTARENEPSRSPAEGPRASGQTCDFCGEIVSSVRRVALDRNYERLRTPHREQYACPSCSDKKERERTGMSRSS